jgi:hypothetical protein
MEYLGVTLDEVTGWKWAAFIHPDDVDGFVANYRSGLAIACRKSDGRRRFSFSRQKTRE